MGLFFHEHSSQSCRQGTKHWNLEEPTNLRHQLQGSFVELGRINHERQLLDFSLNNDKIYLLSSQKVKSLDLTLAGLEQHFYLENGRKIYQFRLMKDDMVTILTTQDKELFIKFYCHMARFCILRHFEKNFKVCRQIGSGAFSVVYQGKNLHDSSQVALKVFKKSNLTTMEDGVEIVRNQILNLEKLKLFNLSPLVQIYQTQDCIVLVLKKANGGDMIQYIKEHPAIHGQQLVSDIMRKIFQNLQMLHSAGFIHRDIKPQNILFDTHLDSFQLFLADFGLTVQKKASDTAVGKKCSGTLGFVAPQVLHENHYDQKCDIFSAGCLIYYLLTGNMLFPKLQLEQIKRLTRDDTFIKTRIKKLPNKLEKAKDLLTNLLFVDPVDRLSAYQALDHPFFNNGNQSQKKEWTTKLCGQYYECSAGDYIKKQIHKFWN